MTLKILLLVRVFQESAKFNCAKKWQVVVRVVLFKDPENLEKFKILGCKF